MIRRLVILMPLLLAACVASAPPQSGYRDASVPLSITTRGTLEALTGDWVVRGAFPDTASIERVSFAPREDGLINVTILQPDCAETCHTLSGTWPAERLAQNRLRLLTDSAQDTELWVIWMDEGVRTAVVGTPDGSAAFVLDRKAQGGGDRIEAAREILDFNGYDVSQLVTL